MPRAMTDAPRAHQRHKARGSTPQVITNIGRRDPICSPCDRQTRQERFRWRTKIGDAQMGTSSKLVEGYDPPCPETVGSKPGAATLAAKWRNPCWMYLGIDAHPRAVALLLAFSR
jgi:hypothetical protein